MPGHHSPRSPSSMHRWRPCPASIRECEGLPDTAGEEAIQGTVFHDYAAVCVENGIDGWGMVGARMLCEDGQYREFTREMAVKMLSGLDLITSIAAAPRARLFVEKRVDLSPWLGPDEFGTSDTFIIDVLQKRLTVFDWKWGAMPVLPEWNDQAIGYVLGVWNSHAEEMFKGVPPEDIEVKIIIEQPRAPGGGGIWTTSMAAILAEGHKIKIDADATRDPNSAHNPGEKQCRFCSAARLNTCDARADYVMEAIGFNEIDDFDARVEALDVAELRDRRAMSPEARSYVLLNRKMIEKWLNQLHEDAMDDAKQGVTVPGMKRVAGRTSARAWRDADKAELILVERLADKAYRKKLLSPAMVEEEVGKKVYRDQWSGHVAVGDPKPILVPESDPKPALVSHSELLDALWDEPEKPE